MGQENDVRCAVQLSKDWKGNPGRMLDDIRAAFSDLEWFVRWDWTGHYIDPDGNGSEHNLNWTDVDDRMNQCALAVHVTNAELKYELFPSQLLHELTKATFAPMDRVYVSEPYESFEFHAAALEAYAMSHASTVEGGKGKGAAITAKVIHIVKDAMSRLGENPTVEAIRAETLKPDFQKSHKRSQGLSPSTITAVRRMIRDENDQ